jgi:hypothetical protein
MQADLPRYINWSSDHVDLTDPFQRRWALRQVLMHGKAQDIRALDVDEGKRELETLNLPPEIYRLWKRFLEHHYAVMIHE